VGGLILRHEERRLVLLDRDGIAVDVRQVDLAISIEVGTSIDFPFYHAEVGGIWASLIAPSRLGRSPLRPRRELGPRVLFPVDLVSARSDSRLDQDGLDRPADRPLDILPPMADTCAPLTCPDKSSCDADTARVISLQSQSRPQISRFQHIWDRGRAARAPRVVFVDREIRQSILRPAKPSSWRGTMFGDHQSFASVARSALMSSYGRGGRGGPQYPTRPNYAPRRPPGGFAAGAFDGGAARSNQKYQQGAGRDFQEGNRERAHDLQ
jgi:hypothetical protein